MLEPSEKDIKDKQKADYEAIALIMATSISYIDEVRKRIVRSLNLERNPAYYQAVDRVIQEQYGKMFSNMKTELLQKLNDSKMERQIVEKTLQKPFKWKITTYKDFPRELVWTKRILSSKSILKRSRVLSKRVVDILKDSADKTIAETTKLIEIELGYRNANGVLNKPILEAIKKGKMSFTNGHIYQAYRIARTEMMRISHFKNYEVYDQLDIKNKRLKLLSIIDGRERQQSFEMNGQISDKQGRFNYYGAWYRLGFQPAQYAINDRETTLIVFI